MDESSRRSKFSFPPVHLAKAYDVVEALDAVAKRKGSTVAQVALAWLLHQPCVTSVIFGAKKESQLKDNLGAVDLQLDAKDLKPIDEASNREHARDRAARMTFSGTGISQTRSF